MEKYDWADGFCEGLGGSEWVDLFPEMDLYLEISPFFI
jgi:hypothetical protein